MAYPKILVGCPTSLQKSYVLNEYVKGIQNLTYPNFDVLIVDNSPTKGYAKKMQKKGLPVVKVPYKENIMENIVYCRNILRQKVLDEGYDYFFSLEQDIIPPPNTLERLLAHQVPIISGLYWNNQIHEGETKFTPVLRGFNPDDPEGDPIAIYFDSPKEASALEGIFDAFMTGVGCLLIHRDVLEKITFRYDPEVMHFDDWFFCEDARNFGYHIYVDTSLQVDHKYDKMIWNKDVWAEGRKKVK